MGDAEVDGIFSGLQVVEFGRFIAAPYCGQLLADGGAEVIKVEPLDGDDTRRNGEVVPSEGRQFLNKNRGKRSIAADLRDADVRDAIQRLASGADIVVCNFRPGQAASLGLDWETLSVKNPRLIYAENTAFGRRGPMASEPGMDLMMVAHTGLAPIGPAGPVDVENPVIDYTAGLLLAWGVSSALFHRERTGRGQRIDVSLLHASLVLQNNHLNHIDVIDDWRQRYLEYAHHAVAEGVPWDEIRLTKRGMQPHAVSRAYYGFFPTQDGVIAISALGRGNQRRFLEVLQVYDRWVLEPGWLPDDARAHGRDIEEQVGARLKSMPARHWMDALKAAGVPVAAARLREEMLDDEQAWANDCFVRLDHDLIGELTVVAPPVAFSETPLRAERASPVLGSDTRAILRGEGLSDEQIARLVARGVIRGEE